MVKKTGLIAGLALVGSTVAVIFLTTRAKAAEPPPPPPPGQATLYGMVLDNKTKSPIASALVSLDGHVAGSSGDGSYYLEDIEPGAYNYVVAKEGYTEMSGSITLEAGINQLNINLTPILVEVATLSGVVADDATKLPIESAMVKLFDLAGSLISSDLSGADGVYVIADITPGTYMVTCEKAGYNTKQF